jgi:hypothetical protein
MRFEFCKDRLLSSKFVRVGVTEISSSNIVRVCVTEILRVPCTIDLFIHVHVIAHVTQSLCRRFDSHCGTCVPIFWMRPYINRGRVSAGVARKRTLTAKSHKC